MSRYKLAIALTAASLATGCGAEDSGHTGPASSSESQRAPAGDLLGRDPYMGVSCSTPNAFECDRVGLAVWLREPAAEVEAAISDRRFELDDPEWSGPAEDGERRMFAGFLQPAGLIDGPLQVTPDAGPDRWIGREPVFAPVYLRVVRSDGTATTTTVQIRLSPGWG